MTNEKIIELLAAFYLDQFAEDAGGVGEWTETMAGDVDAFFEAVQALAKSSV